MSQKTYKYKRNVNVKNERLMMALDKLNDLITSLPKIEEQIKVKYANVVSIRLNEIVRDAVDDFYNDYDPKSGYDRLGSLYTAVDIKVSPDEWDLSMGWEYMKYDHHQGNQFVYENSFENGYHGGSWGIDSNGEIAAEPYFRGPAPFFTNWTNPAPKADISPRDAITEQAAQLLEQEEKNRRDEFVATIKGRINEIKSII